MCILVKFLNVIKNYFGKVSIKRNVNKKYFLHWNALQIAELCLKDVLLKQNVCHLFVFKQSGSVT